MEGNINSNLIKQLELNNAENLYKIREAKVDLAKGQNFIGKYLVIKNDDKKIKININKIENVDVNVIVEGYDKMTESNYRIIGNNEYMEDIVKYYNLEPHNKDIILLTNYIIK